LTTNQAQALERAFRWLDSATENMIVLGDSQSILAAQELQGVDNTWYGTNGWPMQYLLSGNNEDRICLYPDGVSGDSAGVWMPGGSRHGYLTNRLDISRPGGKVKRSRVFYEFAANDLIANATSADLITYVSNTFKVIRNSGCELWVLSQNGCKPNESGLWNSSQDLVRVAYNTWLRANPHLYDVLIDRDLLFPTALMSNTNQATGITRDGLHLRRIGNTMQAQQISAIDAGRNMVSAIYDVTGSVVSKYSNGLPVFQGGRFVGDVYPKKLTMYAKDIGITSGFTRYLSGNTAPPLNLIDTLNMTGAGYLVCYVPPWTTQVVSTLTWVCDTSALGNWTNKVRTYYDGTYDLDSVTRDLVVNFTNGYNFQGPITNTAFPGTGTMQWLNITTQAKSNTASYLYLVKWDMDCYGTPP
jgi:hypothetical protein